MPTAKVQKAHALPAAKPKVQALTAGATPSVTAIRVSLDRKPGHGSGPTKVVGPRSYFIIEGSGLNAGDQVDILSTTDQTRSCTGFILKGVDGVPGQWL